MARKLIVGDRSKVCSVEKNTELRKHLVFKKAVISVFAGPF